MKQLAYLALVLSLAGCSPDVLSPDVRPPPPPPPPPTEPSPEEPRPPVPEASDVVRADVAPPAISGGSLLVTADGAYAVAGDPDLDRIYVVDLTTNSLAQTFTLAEDSEPGRLVEDADGVVHAVMRRAGTIVDFDPAGTELLRHRAVCAAPRGIAHRASDDTLLVACAEGRLISLPAGGGAATSETHLADDLRDVVVTGEGNLLISRFRAPEILHVSGDGHALLGTIVLPRISQLVRMEPRPGDEQNYAEPGVLWRMVAAERGALVLHQRASSGVVETDPEFGGYGGLNCFQPAVVQTTASFVTPAGDVTVSPQVLRVALGVDLALSPDGASVAIAAPGFANPRFDDRTPPMETPATNDLLVYSSDAFDIPAPPAGPDAPPLPPADCIETRSMPPVPGPGGTVAVAYGPGGGLVAFARAPSRLVVTDAAAESSTIVALAEEQTFDTGHEIFHSATSGGLACASCHPEGGDDGRVWFFRGFGARRTQTLSGGLLGSEPFHWSGDMDDFATLAHTVFEGRMRGSPLADNELTAFVEWLDTLEPPARPAVDPASAERGRLIFESTEAACATCHGGPLLTNSLTVDVGTGEPLQVPSLVGLARRAPYMHDGCAPDLLTRLTDPGCGGGELHGHTAHLNDAQLADLVTHLQTL